MRRFLITSATLGVAYWVADFVLDRWVIRSDSADGMGFVTQAEGFGLDDIIRLATVGAVSTFALDMVKGR